MRGNRRRNREKMRAWRCGEGAWKRIEQERTQSVYSHRERLCLFNRHAVETVAGRQLKVITMYLIPECAHKYTVCTYRSTHCMRCEYRQLLKDVRITNFFFLLSFRLPKLAAFFLLSATYTSFHRVVLESNELFSARSLARAPALGSRESKIIICSRGTAVVETSLALL